ncbi:hypothetical protein WPS_26070 [Vulcanimicrobium alpinum]|uniref:Histidine kinase/HSP90-like ATPase domain-containing protein n=1 Tax=Vulcanimicrobium alpinum TaxID=3016050 RepID=A0AAN2CAP4_UNVUL|nr:anti-sigma regulatory factor [Vulcanimicrobium alpinum]BDE07331.1 hypothetical protein WPS_26070 [Vulcanimicrobium alpinum]
MDGTARIPAGAGASLRLRVPPDPRYGRYVRDRVAGFAQSHGVPEIDVAEFVTAVAEGLANAIEHSGASDSIEVACWLVGGDQLFATVVDYGQGFEPPETVLTEPALPDVMSERGRGLPLMKKFTDLFSVRSTPGKGTSVILGRSVRRRADRDDSAAIAG